MTQIILLRDSLSKPLSRDADVLPVESPTRLGHPPLYSLGARRFGEIFPSCITYPTKSRLYLQNAKEISVSWLVKKELWWRLDIWFSGMFLRWGRALFLLRKIVRVALFVANMSLVQMTNATEVFTFSWISVLVPYSVWLRAILFLPAWLFTMVVKQKRKMTSSISIWRRDG